MAPKGSMASSPTSMATPPIASFWFAGLATSTLRVIAATQSGTVGVGAPTCFVNVAAKWRGKTQCPTTFGPLLGAVDARPSWSLALARRNLAASGSSATSTTTPDSVFQGTGRLWAARMCRTRILPPLRSFITTGRWPAARMWMGARGHSSRSFLPCRQLRSL